MMRPRSLAVLLLASLVGLACGSSGPDDADVPATVQQAVKTLDTLVPQLMRQTGVPGVAVSVTYQGQTLYARGFGVRKLGEPAQVDADTVFQLASVSKSVAATVMAAQMPGSLVNGANDWNTPVQALLPSFKGAHAIRDAFDYGVKVTGVTVHFADDKYDCGPIIAQRALTVEEGWDVDELEAHIHEIEHELYPEVVGLLAAGRVHVGENGKVSVDPQ